MNEFDLIVLDSPCSYCAAEPGDRCTSRNGSTRRHHAARCYVAQAAYRLGFDDAWEIRKEIEQRRLDRQAAAS